MFSTRNKLKRKGFLIILGGVILFCVSMLFVFCLPSQLFKDTTSTILYSSDGELLGAKIAKDGQWRFPDRKIIPKKIEKSLLTFEDKYFYSHPGVNLFSLIRALFQDIKAGHIVSGGSTISMQLIRLSRKGKARNIYQKCVEIFMALRLELSYSKKEILAMYLSNAPFGGNVVGLDAASWRFYNRSADELSWAEAATLAVLPNAPSLIFPGKNSILLIAKRNRLLARLLNENIIDSTTYYLSKLEGVPQKIDNLPHYASQLLDRVNIEHNGEQIKSTIDFKLQKDVDNIIHRYSSKLYANNIFNAAILVAEVETGNVLAYVGNISSKKNNTNATQVDLIRSERSTGSLLKPFLYASMLDEGMILPTSLIADIPTQIAGYSPKNFNLNYSGAVPAHFALSRSLNVPAVRMLRKYGVERFYLRLKNLGMSSLHKEAGHYGLALILGGSEGTLWNMSGMYASMARLLLHYTSNESRYLENDIRELNYIRDFNDVDKKNIKKQTKKNVKIKLERNAIIGAGAIYNTFDALLDVHRPDGQNSWKSFSTARKIAWKTGTSFGFRDAWAIGVDRKYIVGVWVGNADGEGRSGLTGVSMASPLMFDVFNKLPKSSWFDVPYDDLVKVAVCSNSGYKVGKYCENADTILAPPRSLLSEVCPYHILVHLDSTMNYRVTSSKVSPKDMIHKSWFVLPPAMEWYYRRTNTIYRALPPYRGDCIDKEANVMQMIYPKTNNKLFLPRGLDGEFQSIVFEIAHNQRHAIIYWNLDNNYIGKTVEIHKMELIPLPGKHLLTLTDNKGNILKKKFTVK